MNIRPPKPLPPPPSLKSREVISGYVPTTKGESMSGLFLVLFILLVALWISA